jgi:signal-transduction protein with cAMP-binding, CBS, and nucleotidyltransferase domain
MAGAFREANADKIYNRLSALGYKAKRIAINKHGLYPVFMVVMLLMLKQKSTKRNPKMTIRSLDFN